MRDGLYRSPGWVNGTRDDLYRSPGEGLGKVLIEQTNAAAASGRWLLASRTAWHFLTW